MCPWPLDPGDFLKGTEQVYQGESAGVEIQNLIFEAEYYENDQDLATE